MEGKNRTTEWPCWQGKKHSSPISCEIHLKTVCSISISIYEPLAEATPGRSDTICQRILMDTSVPDHLQPSVTAVSFPQCHSPSISMPCAAHELGHGAEGTPVAPRCLWGDAHGALSSQGAGGALTLTQTGWGWGRAEPLSA